MLPRTWLVVAILLVATYLRAYRLQDESLWYDEGFSIALARASPAEAVAWTAQDVHPPLYYLLLHLWVRPCGDSAFSVRGLSALAGMATVPLLYAVGKRISGPSAGLLAALLTAVSPLYIYYSREARMYALLTLLAAASAYIMLRITDNRPAARRRIICWAAYLFTALGASYVHYFALFVLGAEAIYFLLWWWSTRRPAHWLIKAGFAALLWLLAYAPWIPVLVSRYQLDSGYWQGRMRFRTALARILTSFTVGVTVSEPTSWYLTVGHLALLGVGAMLFL